MTMAGTGWRRSALTAAVALVTVAACGTAGAGDDKAGGQSGEPVVLTMLNPLGDVDSEAFVQEVERASGGALRIEIESKWHGDDVAKERDVIEAIRDGAADLGITPVRAWHEAGVRSFDALIAPLAVDSPELQRTVLESDIASEMLAGPAALGLAGVAVLPGPMRQPVGISRDLLGPETYAGAHLAISPGAVGARSLQALGATTTATVFEGADMSTFDGMELQVAAVGGNRYDEVARSVTANVALWPRPLVVFGNADALAELTDPQREILRAAGQHAARVKNDIDRSQLQEELDIMCRRGGITFAQATPEQIAGLRSLLQPVYAWLEQDAQTRDLLGRIRALAGQTAAVQPALGCPDSAAEPPVVGQPTALDGVYTMTSSYEQLVAVAGPQAAAEDAEENHGAHVFVFDRGRFAYTQEQGAACTWGYGRFSIDGATMTWDFDAGGGRTPNGALSKPGEHFEYGWSLYRETLTLTPVPGALSPANYLAVPWTRTSTRPDPAALNPSCPPPAEAFR